MINLILSQLLDAGVNYWIPSRETRQTAFNSRLESDTEEKRGFGRITTLEATQEPIDGFSRQVPYKRHLNRVTSVGN